MAGERRLLRAREWSETLLCPFVSAQLTPPVLSLCLCKSAQVPTALLQSTFLMGMYFPRQVVTAMEEEAGKKRDEDLQAKNLALVDELTRLKKEVSEMRLKQREN